MVLYHYYEESVGPFVNLSDIPINEAKVVLDTIKASKPNVQSAGRWPGYMENRHRVEDILRTEFTKKGGVIRRQAPHYMVVGHSPWLGTWYERSACLSIPITEFDVRTISFTYGDSHPVFSLRVHTMDGKEYRNRLYTYEEILDVIQKYGLPQDWNSDGQHGPERYVEAHVWSDGTIGKYIRR